MSDDFIPNDGEARRAPDRFIRFDDGATTAPEPSFQYGNDIIRGLSAPGRSALIESIAQRLDDGSLESAAERRVAATWLNIVAARELR